MSSTTSGGSSPGVSGSTMVARRRTGALSGLGWPFDAEDRRRLELGLQGTPLEVGEPGRNWEPARDLAGDWGLEVTLRWDLWRLWMASRLPFFHWVGLGAESRVGDGGRGKMEMWLTSSRALGSMLNPCLSKVGVSLEQALAWVGLLSAAGAAGSSGPPSALGGWGLPASVVGEPKPRPRPPVSLISIRVTNVERLEGSQGRVWPKMPTTRPSRVKSRTSRAWAQLMMM
mmetsp:Transcript_124593/g.215947  ORF Transcript_124593/g.215947 Transcript_124593/m.215947 type:complete len:229 (-) Transcript_124593:352-1038(-)